MFHISVFIWLYFSFVIYPISYIRPFSLKENIELKSVKGIRNKMKVREIPIKIIPACNMKPLI